MKNFFKIIVLAAVFCFVASCENSIGKKNLEPNDNDSTDSEMSDEDADTGDTETPDEGDTEKPIDQDGEENPDEDDTSDTTDEDGEDVVDTDTGELEYKSPYGSLSFSFENIIGTKEEPGTSYEVLATGVYGNASTDIRPVYADKIQTDAFIYNDYLQIQQTPIYVDGTLGNPVVVLYIPVETASDAGIYGVNYNGDTSVVIADADWDNGTIGCYHAFGEGQLEIEEVNINYSINLSGEATLYHPKNYNGEDVSAEFLQIFTGTTSLCDPVN